MLITTTPFIEGRPVREYKGAIYAQSILGANVVLDLLAAIRDFIGGHSKSYERVLARAREDAMKNLIKEAEKLGANAILAVARVVCCASAAAKRGSLPSSSASLRCPHQC